MPKKGEKEKIKTISLPHISIALYMGLQYLVFYSVLTWMPKIVSSIYNLPFRSGLVITIIQGLSLIPAFLVPIMCQKMNVCALSMVLTLLFVPGIVIIGFGTSLLQLFIGSVFCAIKGKTATKTASLISFCQFIGYMRKAGTFSVRMQRMRKENVVHTGEAHLQGCCIIG